jgi:hypothetical protein
LQGAALYPLFRAADGTWLLVPGETVNLVKMTTGTASLL